MSHFIFKAKKPSGELYSSARDAADRFEFYRLIRESGDELVSMQEKRAVARFNLDTVASFFQRVNTNEKINFARNVGSMIDAGLALSRALSVLERQSRNAALVKVLNSLINDINRGETFTAALGKFPKVFPPVFISMVRAGEQSGTLSESLRVIAKQMDSSYTLQKRVRGALIYPAVILSAMVIIAILMFIFVIPTLMKTFVEMHVDLPWTTQMILDVSIFVQEQGLLVALVLLVAVAGIAVWSRRPSGKNVIHALILRIPLIGPLIQEVNAARTARTLSSLLNSGVDVVESVNMTAQVVQNVHFQDVLKVASASIKQGQLMSKVFSNNPKLYPVFFAEMMSVGEETGKIGDMLMGVANYYEDDVDQKTKNMSTVIEPVLMIVVGAAVGFFAVSMITPIYSLVNAV